MDQYGLIDALARDEGITLSRRKIKKSVAVIFAEITQALARGQRVELDGIGVFSTMTLGPRWGRNPKTGHSVMRPKTTNPTFRADKKLTARLNNDDAPKGKKRPPSLIPAD